MDEARQAVEPALRERWYEYRHSLMLSIVQAIEPSATPDEVMRYVCSPSMEYPCPPELAVKVIMEE